MAVCVPSDIAMQLAKVLGIDTETALSFELRVAAGEVVSVTVCRYVKSAELQEFAKVLDEYELVKKTSVEHVVPTPSKTTLDD